MIKYTFSALGAAALAATVTLAPSASGAATIDAAVPTSFITEVDGSEWVWGSYCSPTGCGSGSFGVLDLSFQSDLGWRLPTVAEVTSLVTALGGLAGTASTFGALGCALQYFTNETASSCSTGDFQIGAIYNYPGSYVGNSNVDTILVRDAAPVPVPASLPLLAGAVAGGVAIARRRKAKA